MASNPILWKPSLERLENSAMHKFMVSLGFNSYSDLHRWSVQNVDEFWLRMVDVGGIQFTKTADCVLNQPGDITSAVFFGGAELSFPEHILRHTGKRPAIIFRGENGSRRELSFDELGEQVWENGRLQEKDIASIKQELDHATLINIQEKKISAFETFIKGL